MKRGLLTAVLVALFAVAGAAQAGGDAAAGKTKAGTCAGCHGANGEGSGTIPPLAGMSEDKFVQAIGEFQSGKRSNTAMKVMSKKLKAQDTEDIAAYYSSLKK
ncbi:MAG: c-type cytochrome [Burkholderiales bacterium]